jgi:hypothetical protein
MQGRIYISGSFTEIIPPLSKEDWRDNCPHFWSEPPTWGICRPDFRKSLSVGDYVFFVLPANVRLPQMIYGYMRILEKIDHLAAYHRPELFDKRMGNKNPNGNIIVDSAGNYNKFDMGFHLGNFSKIKQHYVIGDPENSEFLTEAKLLQKQPAFQATLNAIFNKQGKTPIDVITRKGRRMDQQQVASLLHWLK